MDDLRSIIRVAGPGHRRRKIGVQRARDKNDTVDSAIFAAVSDMQPDG
jgi:hypothetical protein